MHADDPCLIADCCLILIGRRGCCAETSFARSAWWTTTLVSVLTRRSRSTSTLSARGTQSAGAVALKTSSGTGCSGARRSCTGRTRTWNNAWGWSATEGWYRCRTCRASSFSTFPGRGGGCELCVYTLLLFLFNKWFHNRLRSFASGHTGKMAAFYIRHFYTYRQTVTWQQTVTWEVKVPGPSQ